MLPKNRLFYTKKNQIFDKLLTVLCAPDSWCKELYTNIFNSLLDASIFRSNRSQIFCKIDILKIVQNSQKNICAGVSISMMLQASRLQFCKERDSGTGVFCIFCKNLRTAPSYCLCVLKK